MTCMYSRWIFFNWNYNILYLIFSQKVIWFLKPEAGVVVDWSFQECAMEASTVCGELYQKEQDLPLGSARVTKVICPKSLRCWMVILNHIMLEVPLSLGNTQMKKYWTSHAHVHMFNDSNH